MTKTLDREAPFGEVVGAIPEFPGARYCQHARYFRADGAVIDAVPAPGDPSPADRPGRRRKKPVQVEDGEGPSTLLLEGAEAANMAEAAMLTSIE